MIGAGGHQPGRRWLIVWCAVAVAVPFLVTRFVPATDLAQHVAQLRLLGDALTGRSDLYQVQWLTPYSLSYAVFTPGAVAWPLLGETAGRLGLAALALCWVGAAHALARRRGRSTAAAVLACGLAFNLNLYWGFVPFYAGWPLFALWWLELEREDRGSAETPAGWFSWRLAALAAALYFCHALWFGAAAAWTVVSALASRPSRTAWLQRAAALTPPAIALAIWYPSLGARGFDSPSLWGGAGERLLATLQMGFEGLRGPFEPVFLILVGLWLAAGWIAARGRGAAIDADRPLLLAAAVLFAFGLALPSKFQNVIHFADRWLPSALTLLVLGSPAPRIDPRRARLLGGVVLTLLALSTAAVWFAVESVELAGLAAAIDAVPDGARVLGLVYDDRSALLAGRPFHNQVAWAQVAHGGVASFSFAEFATALVVYRDPHAVRWTPALDWLPRTVRREDFARFDVVIVQGSEDDQRQAAALGGLEPLTPPARWRLYRSGPPPARPVPRAPAG